MRKLYLLLLALLFVGSAQAQIDTLNHLKFEATSYPWTFNQIPGSAYSVGNSQWINTGSVGDAPNTITANSPANLRAMRDLDEPSLGRVMHELRPGVIDISAYATEDVQLSFFYASNNFNPANFDTLAYQVEYDNGTTWTSPIVSLNPNTGGAWQQEVIDVPLGEDFVRIRFLARLSAATGDAGWAAYDDIVLYKQPSVPVYEIATVTADADNDFVADSTGVFCELRGTVHGVDMQGGANIEFTLVDTTGGIGVFHAGGSFGYTVNQGDSVHVRGEIGAFNGNTQISDLDTIIFISPTGTIREPVSVTSLGEDTESEIIQLDSVYLVDPSQWSTSGNFNFDVTNGVDTFAVRIDEDTDIDGSPVPTLPFNLSGIGGQRTFNTPPNDGYRILPRYTGDFEFILPISVKSADCGGPVVLEIPYSGAGILWDNPAASTADTAEYTAAGAVNVSVDDNYGASISFGNATAVGDTMIMFGTPVGSGFTLPSDTVCADTTETYVVGPNVNPPGTAYEWDFDGAGNAQGSSVDFAFPDPGTFDVKLTATDPSGNCVDSTTLSIVVEDCAPAVIPAYDIGTVTADSDNDGLADSLGVTCELTGTVYGVDLQGGANNLQFTLIDATGGIAAVNFGSNLGYTVQEGDLVRVVGTIGEFNGLAQIEDLTEIALLGGNQPLGAPAIVTSLGEDTESEYIELQGLTFVDTADWDGTGSSFNIEATDGTNTYTIRIDNDVDLADLALGFDYPFNLVGIGGQFDNSAPFTDGYQILPRNSSDFTFDLPVSVKSEGCAALVLQIPYDDPSISWSNGSMADTTLVSSTGAIDAEIPDFGANSNFGNAAAVADTFIADLPAGITFDSFSGFPGDTICVDESYTLTFTGSTADTYSWDFGEGGGPITNSDSTFSYTYFAEGTFSGEIVLSSGACTLTETFTITVAADDCTPSSRPSAFGDLNVYPNPADDRLRIETTAQLEQIQLFDLQGRAVNHIRVERMPTGYELQLPDVAQGLYLLQLRSAEAQTSLKLQVR